MGVISTDLRLFTCGKASNVTVQSRLVGKIKNKTWIKRDEIYGKTPEFPRGKITVFPARKLKIAQSHNREMRQVTYLRNIVNNILFTAGSQF